MRIKLLLFIGLLMHVTMGMAQQDARSLALRHLQTQHERWGLTATDVSEVRVTDEFFSESLQLTHVWVQQHHAGVPVYNALFGLHVRQDGQVLTNGHRFVENVAQKVRHTTPVISAAQALRAAMDAVGFQSFTLPPLRQQLNGQHFLFAGGDVSRFEIPVKLCWQPLSDGSLFLAWDVALWSSQGPETWSLRVSADDAAVLEIKNLTSQCHFIPPGRRPEQENCTPHTDPTPPENEPPAQHNAENGASGKYRVFALPVESPVHGNRQLISQPHDPVASPLGWHATGTSANQQYTYTRGNNIRAYSDQNNTNQPPANVANEVNGGALLVFDFPFNPLAEPEVNREAAVTNLFYMTNMMHDIAYRNGLNEPAGAFQVNNFGNGGLGNDPILAEALDGSGTDNANFSPAPDGQPGRIQMFKWSGTFALTVNEPENLRGDYLSSNPSWGSPVTNVPVTAPVVIVNDGFSSPPSLGCGEPLNDVAGKIALIDRGSCEFGFKALNAQKRGAKGCIICNYENQLPNMGAGAYGAQVTIPVVAMRHSDCEVLRKYAGNGLVVSLVRPTQSGPAFYDGDFDNGIIAHEYAHGISHRLVGGPSSLGCLTNAEQMGEGWSDFYALATTTDPSDTPQQRRGIGTYVYREMPDGGGIRRFPYSTDLQLQPLTYYNVAHNTGAHALGEVWAAMLWDLYWALVEVYGFSEDLFTGNGGNNKAIRLVTEAMKLVPCSPGFVDGRDAILLADQQLYGGANRCLIWSVFARRGLGEGASQGSPDNASDGRERFNIPISCQNELTLVKRTTTPLIDPGGQVKYVLTVRNGKSAVVNNVVVVDEIPDGLNVIPNTINNGGQLSGNTITWNIGALVPQQTMTLVYSANSDPQKASTRLYFDDLEGNTADWLSFSLDQKLSGAFYLQSMKTKSGQNAWKADNLPQSADFVLYDLKPKRVQGHRPVLRFWHAWNIETGLDGGFVEISDDDGNSWHRVKRNQFLRNGYVGGIPYQTIPIPYLDGFYGVQQHFLDSYIDLAQFSGKNILFRLRFASNSTGGADGWYIDDFELLDLFNYNTKACASSAEGDVACAYADAEGVIVNSNGTVNSTVLTSSDFRIFCRPNPTRDVLSLSTSRDVPEPCRIMILGVDGKLMAEQHLTQWLSHQPVVLQLQPLPQGIYFVRVESGKWVRTEKIVRN